MSENKDIMHSGKKDIISIDNINDNGGNDSAIAKFFKKPSTILIIILLVGWAVTYFYLTYTHSKDIDKVEKAANEIIFNQSAQWIKQTIKPLAWSIRSEMLRDNRDNVDNYQNAFVRDPGFTNLMIVNNDGKVWVSTNKMFEGTTFTDAFDAIFLNQNEIYLQGEMTDREIKVSAPIMGLERRLGTLFVIYIIQDDVYFDAGAILKKEKDSDSEE